MEAMSKQSHTICVIVAAWYLLFVYTLVPGTTYYYSIRVCYVVLEWCLTVYW